MPPSKVVKIAVPHVAEHDLETYQSLVRAMAGVGTGVMQFREAIMAGSVDKASQEKYSKRFARVLGHYIVWSIMSGLVYEDNMIDFLEVLGDSVEEHAEDMFHQLEHGAKKEQDPAKGPVSGLN